jgi:deazaflavin-dependent oxidoreductase (nitroreductase family)
MDEQQGSKITEQLARVTGEENAYLTTTGRVSGQPHEVEIWFAVEGEQIYMLSGGGEGADWVKNIRKSPAVTMRIGDVTFRGSARVVAPGEEDARARRLLAAKYERWREGRPLSNWARTALPVAIDVSETVSEAERIGE